MSLRLKLALALTFAAILPLGVVAGLLLLSAERRAAEDAAARLHRARQQAALLIEGQQAALRDRVGRAAADLAATRGAATALQQGPASAARDLARRLAERNALDLLEIRGAADGALLASSAAGPAPALALETAGLADSALVLAPLPVAPLPPPAETPPPEPPPTGEEEAPDRADLPDPAGGPLDETPEPPARPAPVDARALVSCRAVTIGNAGYLVLGAVALGRSLLRDAARFTGGPAALVGPDGAIVESTGEPTGPVITADVPVAPGGWSLRVAAPAADADRVRGDLRAAFGGVAPVALGSALLVGVLLAAGIARPIRALAARAEAMAARHDAPLTPGAEHDEVRGLTRSFDRMLEGLAESERQRLAAERVAAWQEVARRVAHEVRNALSPIGLAVENLKRTHARAPAEFDRALEVETATILEEVESLRALVEEFSRFARLPAPQCAPCDLRGIVDQALALLAPRLEAARTTATVADGGAPHRVVADAGQIGRAIKNVLANALDALDGAVVRRIEVTLRSVPGGFEEVVVRDSGPGFPAEALRRVFEPYFTTRAGSGGTGLGMAIVHRLVTEHGGTVSARNLAGAVSGAEVTLRLPVDGPEARGAAVDRRSVPAAGS
jgi:signal transduction histidine kinase